MWLQGNICQLSKKRDDNSNSNNKNKNSIRIINKNVKMNK